MAHSCCYLNTLVTGLLVTWSVVSFYEVIEAGVDDRALHYPFTVLTLLSASVVMFIAITIFSFQLFDIQKDICSNIESQTHGWCCTMFTVLLLEVLCIAGMIVFFSYSPFFPSLSSFGYVAMSYLLVFSLNNIVLLFLIYFSFSQFIYRFCFSRSTSHFLAVFTVIGIPLLILSLQSATYKQAYIPPLRHLTLNSLVAS